MKNSDVTTIEIIAISIIAGAMYALCKYLETALGLWGILWLIGKTFGHLEQSVFLEEIYSILDGQPPEINLINEKNNGENVLEIINKNLVNAVHDISAGGLLVALAEMSMGTNYGVKINKPKNLTNSLKYFFGEDQGRYIVEINEKNKKEVSEILRKNSIYYEIIGKTQKDCLYINEELNIKLTDLSKLNSFWFNNFFRED